MAERKNIFLIGRRGHEGDEDQLTEMLAFLWQEDPEALNRWLDSLGLPTDGGIAELETQFTIPSGKRPDIMVRSNDATTLVESKLRSGFGETQIADYLGFLAEQDGSRALVLLTQRPEVLGVVGLYGQDHLGAFGLPAVLALALVAWAAGAVLSGMAVFKKVVIP